MPGTISHVLSMTTPNDPLYENQPKHWNSSHLFTLNVAGSEISNAFGNGGGVTFGYDGTNITGSAPAAAASPVNFSAGTTNQSLGSVSFGDSNGISFGLGTGASSRSITATVKTDYQSSNANYLTSQSNQNAVAQNGNFNFQTISFSNANNFSFGTSAGSAITGSYTVPTVTNSSWTVSDAATSGTVARLAFTNLNGVTLSLSSGAGGSHTIVGSHNALTSQSNQAVSNSLGSFTFQTLNFSNANGVTWGTSAGGIVTASVAAGAGGVAAGVSNTGNTLGNTGTASAGTIVFAASGAVTASMSTAANQSTIWYSVNSQTNQSAIKGFGVSNTGNTSGNTGISTGIDWVIAGTGAITASQSTAGGGPNTVWVSAPATSSIVGTNGISVSTNGSTISVLPNWISSYENLQGMAGAVTSTWNGASISHAVAFNVPWALSLSFIRLPMSMTTNSTTISTINSATASAQGGITHTFNAGIYSLGVGASSRSLQSVTTGTASFQISQKISMSNTTQGSYSLGFSGQANGAGSSRTTQYSVSNTNYSFTTNQIATEWSGGRFLDIPCAASLSPGRYWLVIGMSSNSSSAGNTAFTAITNCNVRYSNHYAVTQIDSGFGVMGSTDFTSGGQLGVGSFSTAGGGTTNSLPISAISSNASQGRIYFQMLRSA